MSASMAKLSCSQCSQRKTRCDKRLPQCGACERAGLQCAAVLRQRKPRGKSGNARHKDPAVQARISRLENLVSQLQDQQRQPITQMQKIDPDPLSSRSEIPEKPSGSKSPDSASTEGAAFGGFIARDFWEQLSGAVNGLRDVLESPEADDEENSPETAQMSTPDTDQGPSGLLFGVDTLSMKPDDMSINVSVATQRQLLDAYGERVDTIFKAVYWPTTRLAITASWSGGGTLGQRALEPAVYFMAVCTLTDDEISNRGDLINYYRGATEAALTRANVLTSTDTAVVQALVLYAYGLRSCGRSAEFWALVATVVRLATHQGLDQLDAVPPKAQATLEYQTKKRLWLCISTLDIQSSFDRGSRPLLTADYYTSLPLDVDDADLMQDPDHIASLSSTSPTPDRWTDMSFSIWVYKATISQRHLAENAGRHITSPQESQAIWTQNIKHLADFEAHVSRLSALACPGMALVHQFALTCAEDTLHSMSLFLRRPMTKSFRPPVQDHYDVLPVATEILEHSLFKHHRAIFRRWMWFIWVPWQALAVVLAELCGRRTGEDADRAWNAAGEAYDMYENLVADGRGGLLWRPIVKLMRRAKAVRAAVKREGGGGEGMRRGQDMGAPELWAGQHTTVPEAGAAWSGAGKNMQQTDLFAGAMDPGLLGATSGVGLGTWDQNSIAPFDWMAGMDLDAMAWTNWETFVDDLSNPNEFPI